MIYKPVYLSESVVKMSRDLTSVLGYFTPSRSQGVSFLDQTDSDSGCGGVPVIPA
jgi:hypothetical protein